jgi:hypothetical protein
MQSETAIARTTALEEVLERASILARRLSTAGMVISAADRFVIAASQTLISASAEELSFEEIRAKLQKVRQRLEGHAVIPSDKEMQKGLNPTPQENCQQ